MYAAFAQDSVIGAVGAAETTVIFFGLVSLLFLCNGVAFLF